MTREKTLEILEHNWSSIHNPDYTDEELGEALDFVIKALEQEPTNIQHVESIGKTLECEDAISKREVMNMVYDWADVSSEELIKRLNDLPPATPARPKGKWIAYKIELPDREILNYTCSVCGRKLVGYSTETLKDAPYCHCGADMRESE